eukprot:1318455-Lingulodinium_polyedra.AAC.1
MAIERRTHTLAGGTEAHLRDDHLGVSLIALDGDASFFNPHCPVEDFHGGALSGTGAKNLRLDFEPPLNLPSKPSEVIG